MRKILLAISTSVVSLGAVALAQMGQWTTFGHDPQRSGYTEEEHAFSPANVAAMGLEWKTTVPNQPLSMAGLTAPLVVRGVKSAHGEKNLVLVAGSSDHIWALDAETGELAWKVDFKLREPRPGNGDWLCPNALNATPVIDPGKARVFVVSSDGVLHILNLTDGQDAQPPAQFVPAYSKMWSLNYVGGVVYTSISQGCAKAQSGAAAMDPDAPGRPVTRFYTAANGAGVWGRGGLSVGFDDNIYGVTGDAPFDPPANEFGDTVFRLAPRTLQLAGYYTPADWQYLTRRDLDMGTSTPIVFRMGSHAYTAVGGKEGAIYLTDTSAMSGPDHHTTAFISPRYTNAAQTFERNGIWGAMSSYRDSAGQRWLYVPSWGSPTRDAQFPLSYGPANDGSLMAFKVSAGADHKLSLTPAWISQNITVPDPAAIAGGLVFVLGTGEDTRQVNNGDINQLLVGREARAAGHAILYALDAATGKQLWSSGDAISGWTHFSGLAVADGKVFVTTHDGVVYAFALRKAGAPAVRTNVVQGPAASSAPVVSHAAAAVATYVPECGETKTLFVQRCAQCHGPNGKGSAGGRSPDFTDAAWQASRTDAALIEALRNGTDHGMPAFSNQLKPAQIDELIHCMVRGFGQAPAGR
ncbi:MAG TPA: PQQ-binding-like beta-propeller repeat protein [Terracidiphilus sp.]